MKTVLVIGGGFSGAIVTARLLQQPRATPLHVSLLNGSGRIARGMAYGTQSPDHTLNVPAGNMSAFDEDPDHFLRYAQKVDGGIGPASFVSRRIYGDYLEWLLEQAELAAPPTTRLQRIYRHVVSIQPASAGRQTIVTLDSGETMMVDQVVLALGHFPSNHPLASNMEFYNSERYIRDPWDQSKLDGIAADAPVLLLGTGLTAVDIAMTLLRRNPARRITAVSRRGLLPQHHRRAGGKPPEGSGADAIWADALTVRGQLRAFRQYSHALAAEGRDWREGLALLRPVTANLWQSYPDHERKRFLRHVQPYWDTHRHRLAPEVYEQFSAAMAAGTITTYAARLLAWEEQRNGVDALLRLRGREEILTLHSSCVINCTGPCADPRATNNQLVEQLLADGMIRTDRLGLGLDVGTNCAVIDAQGSTSNSLFYIGPWLKANYWEATAVPDLRRYARQLADSLLAAP